MALILPNRYPGRAGAVSAEYPQGSFKNRSAPNVEDGTYMEKDWLNDQAGFFGAILKAAGVTPNGNVDTATSSQVYDALKTLFPLASTLGTAAFKNVGTGGSDVAGANSTMGGTYTNVTSSRAMGVTYTNSATRPMLVIYSCDATRFGTAVAAVNGVTVARFIGVESASTHNGPSMTFIVPPGATYSITKTAGSLSNIIWAEMV
ncbi:putative tail-fiber protein [Edwardsiella phage MSW-3]|uniref:Putative tail-fiber protein n=1 Tax=Edwardsiella phage MSW-3 TaxID=1264700 RepID=L0MY01_9CAUD|nr:tail fiber protein [Edwardsiella phage MSW-3]BAM68862.1 putative tail-fiber protein [Edwardsiella phage MSW-3]